MRPEGNTSPTNPGGPLGKNLDWDPQSPPPELWTPSWSQQLEHRALPSRDTTPCTGCRVLRAHAGTVHWHSLPGRSTTPCTGCRVLSAGWQRSPVDQMGCGGSEAAEDEQVVVEEEESSEVKPTAQCVAYIYAVRGIHVCRAWHTFMQYVAYTYAVRGIHLCRAWHTLMPCVAYIYAVRGIHLCRAWHTFMPHALQHWLTG